MIFKKKEQDKKSVLSKGYLISSIILGLAILLTLYVTIQTLTKGYANFFGYSVFRVVTGSMEPTMPVNTVLLCKSADAEEIETDDIICFRSKESSHYGVIVTHRVVSIHNDENNVRYLESRGDANYSSDPYYVTNDNLIGRVVWYTGKEGVFTRLLAFITGKFGFIALIVLPILLIGGMILRSISSNIRGSLDQTLEELAKMEADDSKDRGEPLPGYETVTQKEYDEIYEKLKREMLEELKNSEKGPEDKTE
ncbi:MAG: signal peptidase I [Clostridia bacterium]|nr:signal peptidase I [Clostridia bacterium]